MQAKVDDMIKKMKRSQEAVEKFKKDQDHEIKLKQELRKLREEDMQKIKERKKRLEGNRKEKILDKEREHSDAVSMLKTHEQMLMKKK
jgi:hypothetical protein